MKGCITGLCFWVSLFWSIKSKKQKTTATTSQKGIRRTMPQEALNFTHDQPILPSEADFARELAVARHSHAGPGRGDKLLRRAGHQERPICLGFCTSFVLSTFQYVASVHPLTRQDPQGMPHFEGFDSLDNRHLQHFRPVLYRALDAFPWLRCLHRKSRTNGVSLRFTSRS